MSVRKKEGFVVQGKRLVGGEVVVDYRCEDGTGVMEDAELVENLLVVVEEEGEEGVCAEGYICQ